MVELLFSLISDIWYVLIIYIYDVWYITYHERMKCDIDVWYRTYNTMIYIYIWYIQYGTPFKMCTYNSKYIYMYCKHTHTQKSRYITYIKKYIETSFFLFCPPKTKRNRMFFCFCLAFADPGTKGEKSRIEGTFVFFEPGSYDKRKNKPWRIHGTIGMYLHIYIPYLYMDGCFNGTCIKKIKKHTIHGSYEQ